MILVLGNLFVSRTVGREMVFPVGRGGGCPTDDLALLLSPTQLPLCDVAVPQHCLLQFSFTSRRLRRKLGAVYQLFLANFSCCVFTLRTAHFPLRYEICWRLILQTIRMVLMQTLMPSGGVDERVFYLHLPAHAVLRSTLFTPAEITLEQFSRLSMKLSFGTAMLAAMNWLLYWRRIIPPTGT